MIKFEVCTSKARFGGETSQSDVSIHTVLNTSCPRLGNNSRNVRNKTWEMRN